MRQQPADFGVEHADNLAAPWNLDAKQPFDREAKGMLLVHRRDIVEPVEVRQRLEVVFILDEFFGAAVQKADVRIGAHHEFAVEFQNQAQDSVCGRVLRTEIDGEGPVFGFGDNVGHDRKDPTMPPGGL